MKYTILINQEAAISSGLDLDFMDLAIFDFIKDFANSRHCTKVHTPNGEFFWISHKIIREELPLLGISTNRGIVKRIDRLVAAGVLVKSSQCEEYGKSLYAFGPAYDLLISKESHKHKDEAMNESSYPGTKVQGGMNESSGGPMNESSGDNNNNIYNTHNDNIDNTHKKSLKLFRDSSIAGLVVWNDGVPDASGLLQRLGEKFAAVDLVYYYEAVRDWSDSANKKRTDAGWLATIRNFMRGDAEKGHLRLVRTARPMTAEEAFLVKDPELNF